MLEHKDEFSGPAAQEIKPETPDLTRREKAALQKIDLARTLAASANRIFLIFSLSLLLCWVQSVWTALDNYRQVTNSRAESASRIDASKDGVLGKAQKRDNDVNSANRALQSKVSIGRSTPFKLPFGFGSVQIFGYAAPLAWTLLTLSLLVYLNYSRRRSLSIASRALRVLKEEVKYTDREFTDACAGFPWWFVPLPRFDGQTITASELRTAVGWIANEGWLNQAGRLSLICIFCLQIATSCLSIVIAIGVARAGWIQFSILVATVSVSVFSLLWLRDWFRLSRVPDSRADEESHHLWGRREAIRALGIGLIGVFLIPPINRDARIDA